MQHRKTPSLNTRCSSTAIIPGSSELMSTVHEGFIINVSSAVMTTDECKAIRATMSKNFTRPPTTFPLEIVRKITDRLFVFDRGQNPRRCLLAIIYSIGPKCTELQAWYFATRETLYHQVSINGMLLRRHSPQLHRAVLSTEVPLAFNSWKMVHSLVIQCVCTHDCL